MPVLMPSALRELSRDGRLLFLARSVRLLAYGSLSVILVFYLTAIGLSTAQAGLLLTITLAGDTLISLWLSTRADRFGRRRMLVIGAVLMGAAGLVFAVAHDFWVLVIAGAIGVISPSGKEVGPFLSIEQAALSEIAPARARTGVFAWYALAGSLATAVGALLAAAIIRGGEWAALPPLSSYRAIVAMYGVLGAALVLLFRALSPAVEAPARAPAPSLREEWLGLHASRRIVLALSALFAVDAFAGGFIVQSFAAYWFHLRFGADAALVSAIFFVANVLAGISALVATRIAARLGLVRTMVLTHLPSNVLLLVIPFMPTLPLAALVLLVRFSISQMDVPTRQAFTMAVVHADERAAAGGVTGVARTAGAAIAPAIAGWMLARPALVSAPFFVAGGLKILYDLAVWRGFAAMRVQEE